MPRDARLLEFAKSMRREPTPTEQRLWFALRAGRLGGAKFRRQQVIGQYIVDFACRRPSMLVIEIDGETHADRSAADAERSKSIEVRGYRVLRFTNREVGENLGGVLRSIADALALPLSPALSPEGAREILK